MTITTVFFDLDDTLVVEERSVEEAFLATCEIAREKHGIDPATLHESIRRNARRIWQAAPTIDYCRRIGISSWEGLWARFLGDDSNLTALREWAPAYRHEAWSAALAELGANDRTCADMLADTFQEERRARHIVFPDAEPVLQELRGRYKMALITNGAPDLQREKIEGAGLGGYFDAIIVSGDIGIGKPDSRIFEAALGELSVQSDEAVMVGNSIKRDIAGAQSVGIKAVLVDRDGLSQRGDIKPNARVTTLTELGSIMQGGV